MSTIPPVDVKAAEDHLMRFLAVEGVTGEEAAIAAAVSDELKKGRVCRHPPSASTPSIQRIPLPTQTGNLIVDLPGTDPGPRLAVRDPPRHGPAMCRCQAQARGRPDRLRRHHGARRRQPHRLRGAGDACRDAAEAQAAASADHAAVHGARGERPARRPRTRRRRPRRELIMCFNVDGGTAADLIIGAVGQENWEVEIRGKASHAGVAPEKGISATLVAALALAEAHRAGWFGKVVKPEGTGTSNPGIFGGKDGRAARRCHQRGHRLRSHQGRGAQPRRGVCEDNRVRLRGSLHQGGCDGEGRRRCHRRGEVYRA